MVAVSISSLAGTRQYNKVVVDRYENAEAGWTPEEGSPGMVSSSGVRQVAALLGRLQFVHRLFLEEAQRRLTLHLHVRAGGV